MRLFIVRHGIAIDRDDPSCPPESERYLTQDGREKSRRVAKSAKALGVEADAWYTSPYVRARETAEIFAVALGVDPSSIIENPALLPDANPAVFIRKLNRDKATSAIAFGHAPHLDILLATLFGAQMPMTDMKKAGIACVEITSFSPLGARLLWLVTPKLITSRKD